MNEIAQERLERAREITDRWSNEITGEESLTQKMREDCAFVLAMFLPRSSNYQAEKFVKTYTEPIATLTRRLKDQEGIGPSDLPHLMRREGMTPSKLQEKREKVQKRIENYLSRHRRHYVTFLASVRDSALRDQRDRALSQEAAGQEGE
jgi:hypothetical protein